MAHYKSGPLGPLLLASVPNDHAYDHSAVKERRLSKTHQLSLVGFY